MSSYLRMTNQQITVRVHSSTAEGSLSFPLLLHAAALWGSVLRCRINGVGLKCEALISQSHFTTPTEWIYSETDACTHEHAAHLQGVNQLVGGTALAAGVVERKRGDRGPLWFAGFLPTRERMLLFVCVLTETVFPWLLVWKKEPLLW